MSSFFSKILQILVQDLDRLLEKNRPVEERNDLIGEHVLGQDDAVLGQVPAGLAHFDRPRRPAPVEHLLHDRGPHVVVVRQART